MAIAKHRASVLDSPTASQFTDKTIFAQQLGIANGAGGGANASVAVVVTFLEALPANYAVHVGLSQDAVAYVSTRTVFSFTVTLLPRNPANTLAAGTFDVTLMAV